MPIEVRCHRGHTFQVSEDKEGEYVPCPTCNMMMPVPVVGYFERKPPKPSAAKPSAPKAGPASAPPVAAGGSVSSEHAVSARPARQAAADRADASGFTFGLGIYVLKVGLLSIGMVLLFVLSYLPSREQLPELSTYVAPGFCCAAGLVGLVGGLLCLRSAGSSRVRLWFLVVVLLDAAQAALAALGWLPGIETADVERQLMAGLARVLLPPELHMAEATGLELNLVATVAGVAAWGLVLVALRALIDAEDLPDPAPEAAHAVFWRWLVQIGLTWGTALLVTVLVIRFQLHLAVFTGEDWQVTLLFIFLMTLLVVNAYLCYRLIEDGTATVLASLSTVAFLALGFNPLPFYIGLSALLSYQTFRAVVGLGALTGQLKKR
jgi:hypothetical protein